VSVLGTTQAVKSISTGPQFAHKIPPVEPPVSLHELQATRLHQAFPTGNNCKRQPPLAKRAKILEIRVQIFYYLILVLNKFIFAFHYIGMSGVPSGLTPGPVKRTNRVGILYPNFHHQDSLEASGTLFFSEVGVFLFHVTSESSHRTPIQGSPQTWPSGRDALLTLSVSLAQGCDPFRPKSGFTTHFDQLSKLFYVKMLEVASAKFTISSLP